MAENNGMLKGLVIGLLALQQAKSKAGDIVGEAKRRSEQLLGEAKKRADTLLQDADKVLSEARTKVGPIVEEGQKVKDALKAGVEAFKDERRRS